MGGVGRGRGTRRVVRDPHDRHRLVAATHRLVIRGPSVSAHPGDDKSWVRLEGELRSRTSGSGNAYQLVDPADDRSYVDVDTTQSLQPGHAVLTGQLGLGSNPVGSPGFLGVIIADDPAVPRRNEPFQLILLPAVLGIALAIGIHQGSPVIRPERRPGKRTAPLPNDEILPARWGGCTRNDPLRGHETVACTLTVAPDRDAYLLTIVDAQAERTLPIRRRAPIRQVRCAGLMAAGRDSTSAPPDS